MSAIKRIRLQKGISQCDLAMEIGVTQAAVSQWELGATKPSFDNLLAIARFLGCKVDDLIDKRGAHEQEAQA